MNLGEHLQQLRRQNLAERAAVLGKGAPEAVSGAPPQQIESAGSATVRPQAISPRSRPTIGEEYTTCANFEADSPGKRGVWRGRARGGHAPASRGRSSPQGQLALPVGP